MAQVAIRTLYPSAYPSAAAVAGERNTEPAREGLDRTSPVGLFPRFRQKELDIEDLPGNVWKWCEESAAEADSGGDRLSRVVRGQGKGGGRTCEGKDSDLRIILFLPPTAYRPIFAI